MEKDLRMFILHCKKDQGVVIWAREVEGWRWMLEFF